MVCGTNVVKPITTVPRTQDSWWKIESLVSTICACAKNPQNSGDFDNFREACGGILFSATTPMHMRNPDSYCSSRVTHLCKVWATFNIHVQLPPRVYILFAMVQVS